MSLSVQVGLLFALATSLASIVGFLFKHRGAVASAPVTMRAPISSSLALLRAPAYAAGILIAMGGWGLHVVALALAPISLVQSVMAGGLVFLTACAERLFGLSVSRRELVCVVLCAIGLSFLAATLSGVGSDAASHYATATLWTYTLAAGALGLLLAIGSGRLAPGSGLALSAGLLWGASDVSIKALSGQLGQSHLGVLVTPLALMILVLSLVGFAISGRSLQVGRPVAVIAATSASANLVTIASGPLVFGEALPHGSLALAAHLIALVLVIGAAALTPPPAVTQVR